MNQKKKHLIKMLFFGLILYYFSTTLLFVGCNGLVLAGSITVPFILSATVGVSALEVTVIVFRIGLTLLVSYFT